MKKITVLILLLVCHSASAQLPFSGPEAVPMLGSWGLLALGFGVVLAGVIGRVRMKKGAKRK